MAHPDVDLDLGAHGAHCCTWRGMPVTDGMRYQPLHEDDPQRVANGIQGVLANAGGGK